MFSLISTMITYVPGFSIVENIYQQFLINVLKTGPVPSHMAFVMDGNRRYAKTHGIALKEGHRLGAESLSKVLDCCFKIGVKYVTTYAFSIENFNRKQEEIDTIFSLLKSKLLLLSSENHLCDLHHVKIRIIGNRSYIPNDVLIDIEQMEAKTAHHTRHVLFIAFPYTSRDDMWHSINVVTQKVENGDLQPAEINNDLIESNFYYDNIPDPVDILVRTSGHTRLSDYMLWQCHQDSVIEYPDTLWPDYQFFQTWWTIFKWSYYKTLIITDAETMQIKKVTNDQVQRRYKDVIRTHPPFASVSKR